MAIFQQAASSSDRDMMLLDGPPLHHKRNPIMQLEKAKKKRKALHKGDGTRNILAALLRRNPLLSYADVAKVVKDK
jgi:hypothetical protein